LWAFLKHPSFRRAFAIHWRRTVRAACATQEIGMGMYSILAQLESQKTGVPLDKIDVQLGDAMPMPMTTAS